MTEQDKPQSGQQDASKNGGNDAGKGPANEDPGSILKKKQHGSRPNTSGQSLGSTNAGDTVKKTAAQHKHKQRLSRVGHWVTGLALVTASAAVFGVYWLWQHDLASTLVLQQSVTQTQQQLSSMQADVTAMQQQLSTAEQTQQSQWQSFQQQQDIALADIRKQLSQSRDPSWLLGEAEYLIRIASHRLQLARDIDTATRALILADQRIQLMHDPRLLPVRRQLSEEITLLKLLPRIDTSGISLTLASMQGQLEQLPLHNRVLTNDSKDLPVSEQAGGDKKGWSEFLSDVWLSLKSLVTVRRVDDKSVAITAPEQGIYLYQNLALKLEAARYALLRYDDALYHQALADVNGWLQRYFDTQSDAVKTMLESLQQLDSIEIDIKLPTLGKSLQALKNISLDQQPTEQLPETSKKPLKKAGPEATSTIEDKAAPLNHADTSTAADTVGQTQ